MERGSRAKLSAAVILGLVFGSGLLTGYAVDSHLEAGPSGAEPETAPRETRRGDQPRPRVYEQLNPTDEQTTRIDSILRVHRERMNALDREYREARRERRGAYDAVIQDTRDAIADVFGPEEAVEYRRLLAEFDRRRQSERSEREGRR